MADKSFTWGLENETVEHWAWAPVFSKEECDFIIEIGNALNPIEGAVTSAAGMEVDPSVRKCNIAWIPVEDHTQWIFQRCTGIINDLNKRYFNFELHKIQSLQFTAYDKDGSFYGTHIDMLNSSGIADHRKLSFSIQLSSPDDYEGGELHLHYKSTAEIAKKELGVATVFPSYCLHEVTPVTSGKRYSLVGWVAGPRFK
jgi:PKHD-type hydroxylase